MILNYDHYRSGQRKQRPRTALITVGAGASLLLVVLALVLKLPSRLFGPGHASKAPGKLPDLCRAENYEGVIAACRFAALRGDPLNAMALSYRGFRQLLPGRRGERPGREACRTSTRPSSRCAAPAWPARRSWERSTTSWARRISTRASTTTTWSISFMESSLAKGYVQKDSNEYIGQAYTQLGDYDKAMEYFLTALEGRLRRPAALDNRANLLPDEAYQRRSRLSPADPQQDRRQGIEERTRFLLGGIYLDTGELFKAEEQFAAIVKIDPQSADAHFVLGEVYAKMNDPVKARGGMAERLDHRSFALRREAPILLAEVVSMCSRGPTRNSEGRFPSWPGTGCSKRFPRTSA